MSASNGAAAAPTSHDTSSHQSLPSISDFEIVKYVSSGAYGDVFLAKRSGQDQLFAVKRVAKSTLVTKNLINQIRCERVALATTRCRHVVHLYYSLQTDSHVYLVMEYLCGGDLRSALVAVGCLPQPAAVMYAAEVAMALEYLHGHGIIHRDIKPDNMLVSASGHIKLTDFGLSQVTLKRVTQQQLLHGTSTPGGYQASAEKRYPRTPRQLMSLATDFSFGSAERDCRQASAAKAAAAAAAVSGSSPSTTFATAHHRRQQPPTPLPPPCFDDSVSPQVDADDAMMKPAAVAAVAAAAAAYASTEVVPPPPAARVRFSPGVCSLSGGDVSTSSTIVSPPFSQRELHRQQQQQHASVRERGQHHQQQRLLGTPDYLAPELILGQPHDTPVDYWALGACLFEFLTGCPPFAASCPEQIMDNILHRRIPWPNAADGDAEDEGDDDMEEADGELSPEAVSAIDGLLRWEPQERLEIGALRGHPLFAGVSWESLHSAEAPFVPDLGGNREDTSYFEPRNRARGFDPTTMA